MYIGFLKVCHLEHCLEIKDKHFYSYSLGSESECIGHFKLIFSLLRVHGAGQVQQLALEVKEFYIKACCLSYQYCMWFRP